jgi:DNA mismatch repair protein MutS2
MDAHALECLDFTRIRDLLAGYAMCGLGKSLAMHIQPVTRVDLVRRWLSQVEELQRLELDRGLPPFGGISDVRETVKRCAPPLRVGVDEMAAIGDTLTGTHAVAAYLRDLPEGNPELQHLQERIGDFEPLAARIRAVIDERGHVRDDASPKLQRVRREIEEASGEIGTAVDRLLHEPQVRRLLQYPNPTFHNDRIVLPLRTEYRGRLQGIIHRTSDSGATLYVEPAQAVELNNRITNLRIEEQEEVNRLIWELAHDVHLNETEILKALDALAVLDLITAKVRFARDFELRCPQISEDAVLNVRQARHPLLLDLLRRRQGQDGRDGEIVPIDYRLGGDFDLLIITGPNTGGKTVTLKTIGLICLMVQAGLPAPVAPGSQIGIFSNVLIDVGDEQSLQQSLSTFSAHLRRLMEMLRRASKRTLVLLDELGAGTDPDEGAAIGKALLDEFLRLETRCVATTHLGALKGYALTRPRVENASVEFDAETLQPTYRLRIGESGSSNAIEVASRLGMPKRLVVAARRNLSRKARALRAALQSTADVKRQAEEARNAANAAREQADRAQSEAGAARAVLQRQQQDFRTWVARVVHLRPGDAVRVRNFDRDGRIVRIRLDQQRAEVNVGAFAVEVPLGDVLPPETPPPPPRPAPHPAVQPPRRKREKPPAAQPASAQQAEQTKAPPKAGAAAPHAPAGPRPARPPRPPLPSLTAEQAAQLSPGDQVYVRRFEREGQFVRLKPGKQLAIVSVGVLEVEVPFEGLALPLPRSESRMRRGPRSRERKAGGQRPKPPEPGPPDVSAPQNAVGDESSSAAAEAAPPPEPDAS